MTAPRLTLDVLLAAALGVLAAGVVHDVHHQVTAIHHRRLDVRAFERWAARGAYVAPHVVSNGRTVDRLCATRAGTGRRVCVTIRRSGSHATVEAPR